MKNIIKYFLLLLLILAAYFIGREIPNLLLINSKPSPSIHRFLSSNLTSIFFSLVIIYFAFDLGLQMLYSYGNFGDIFKSILSISITVIAIYILIFDRESHMIYFGEYDHGLPIVFCLPLPFLLRDLGNYEISKRNIILVFIISIILYFVFSYRINGFDHIVLLIFLGIAFMSVVLFYFYLLLKTILLGNKLSKSIKSGKIFK